MWRDVLDGSNALWTLGVGRQCAHYRLAVVKPATFGKHVLDMLCLWKVSWGLDHGKKVNETNAPRC